MGLKDILVQIDGGKANAARLDLAIELARHQNARLIGLCVYDISLVHRSADMVLINPQETMALLGLEEQFREEALAIAANLENDFWDRIRHEGIDGEWRLVAGAAATAVSAHARFCDLAVLGQQDPEDVRVSGWTTVVESALLTSGRPILVVPYAGRHRTVGRRVLIGWKPTREAARAVHDALALLGDAEAVTVLAIDPERDNEGRSVQAAADISRHLARHGLPVTAQESHSNGLRQATILLNYAADSSSDLVVVGGYGHSRMREIVLGGVTRHLLQEAPVPVLMSH